MKSVMDAFKAIIATSTTEFVAKLNDGSPINEMKANEFTTFWKSLTDSEKEIFKANAAAMGF